MKNSALAHWTSRTFFFLLIQFFALLTFAQEKGLNIDVDVNKKGSGDWYTSPWVWVGGAAFIIILVLALRSNGSKKA